MKINTSDQEKYKCPGCGHEISESSYNHAMDNLEDHLTPRCRCGVKWSEFKK